MSTTSHHTFRPPPIVECIASGHCLGIGKKVYHPGKVCATCLQRYDCQQLRTWASNNAHTLALVGEEYKRRQTRRRNIESCNRYLCAFEDPDFEHCQWRRRDYNLRGTRLNCKRVGQKGRVCDKCWRRRERKVGVTQYFTRAALCHEELESVVTSPEDAGEGTEEEDDDDVEGYNTILD
jgi:hypothetical protein